MARAWASERSEHEAKDPMATLRRYCDDVQFQVGKDSRDTLRRIQRQLRDHYSTRADELHRSTTEALKAASDAATIGEAERKRRKLDIEAELKRIGVLRERASSLATTVDVGAVA